MLMGSQESFRQLSSTIIKHWPNERKLSTTLMKYLSKFNDFWREFQLSSTLILVGPGFRSFHLYIDLGITLCLSRFRSNNVRLSRFSRHLLALFIDIS